MIDAKRLHDLWEEQSENRLLCNLIDEWLLDDVLPHYKPEGELSLDEVPPRLFELVKGNLDRIEAILKIRGFNVNIWQDGIVEFFF